MDRQKAGWNEFYTNNVKVHPDNWLEKYRDQCKG